MIIAISGPPTPSETASLGSALAHAVRRFDSAALHFTFDLCDSVPVAAHAAGVCAKPTIAIARAEPRAQAIQVSAVSQTLPPSAREILPPDTIDQIARPAQQRSELLGEGRPAPRLAHARSPRITSRIAPRHPTRGTNAARARSLRAGARHPTREAAAHLRGAAAHARPLGARPRHAPPPLRRLRATPIAAPRASATPSPARAAPEQPTPAPAVTAEAAPPAPAPPAPEEHANVPDDQQAPPPQSDQDSQSNNPQSDQASAEDVKS